MIVLEFKMKKQQQKFNKPATCPTIIGCLFLYLPYTFWLHEAIGSGYTLLILFNIYDER